MASYLSPVPQRNWLQALTLCVWIAVTLAEDNSSFVVRALGQAQRPVLKSVQRLFLSLFTFIVTLTRQRYLRIINGHIGVWDMVQLITACSLVQTIRIWRRQKEARQTEPGSSNEPTNNDPNRHDSTTALSRVESHSSKTGKYDVFPVALMRLNQIIWH